MSSSESQDTGAAVPAQESVLTDLEFAQIMEGTKVISGDITASVAEPAKAWSEFCAEANINHDGAMLMPALDTQAEPAKEKQQ